MLPRWQWIIKLLNTIKGTESGFYATYRSIPEDVPVRTGHVLYANTGGASSRLLIKTEDDDYNATDQHGLEMALMSHDD